MNRNIGIESAWKVQNNLGRQKTDSKRLSNTSELDEITLPSEWQCPTEACPFLLVNLFLANALN